MYIQIGSTTKPANVKVAGGFIADTPIAKITNYNVTVGQYYGTPSGSFTKAPSFIPPVSLNISLTYFKSYADYLNGESPLMLQGDATIPANSTGSLPYNIQVPSASEPVTDESMYNAAVEVIKQNFDSVKTVVE